MLEWSEGLDNSYPVLWFRELKGKFSLTGFKSALIARKAPDSHKHYN
jgi:hypothetical protein